MRICSTSLKKNKVLIFKNIMGSFQGKGFNRGFSCGSHYLATSFILAGIPCVFSEAKISLLPDEFITARRDLEQLLDDNKDINFILITLSEFYFEKIKQLVDFLRSKSKAYICMGGIMPTLSPGHVQAHIPKVDIVVRGVGEKVMPQIVAMLDGKNYLSKVSKEEKERLSLLKGAGFLNKKIHIDKNLKYINLPDNYDDSLLDFSFIKKNDLAEGLCLFTSWGCFNNCYFCTGFARGKFIAKSMDSLKKILSGYLINLKKIYGRKIPREAFRLSFYDDDFLGDPQRAVSFFRYIRSTPFRINFFQTGINSFFEKEEKNKYSDRLNKKLLDSLDKDIFDRDKQANIYVGLENLSDKELGYLGKGYDSVKAETVIRALADKKIKAVYHFIVSNQRTSLKDLADNLFKFAKYQKYYEKYFRVLVPVIPYLVSLCPSISYKRMTLDERTESLKIRSYLSIEKRPDLDYPLVEQDIPISKTVRMTVPILAALFDAQKYYVEILDKFLFYLLMLNETDILLKKEIVPVIREYRNYFRIISGGDCFKYSNNRGSLQLMITRKCQLRCKYCPILKGECDMSIKVLHNAVNFLFTSSRKNLRLDFTGGEPLLRFDLVKEAVQYARKLAREKKKNISFYMVTNLIALNDEASDFLSRENFLLELSLDGEETSHNLFKIGKSKRINPYRLTAGQLNKVLCRKINNYAVMVVNAATVKYLYRNFCHVVQLGVRNIGINYALCSFWSKPQRVEFFRQLGLIKKNFGRHIAKGILNLGNLGMRDEPAVLNSEIMVNCDGRIYFLTDWLFEKQKKKNVPSLGEMKDFVSIDDIFMSKFRILSRLFEYHSARQRGIILNNIEMGYIIKRYFELWKKELNQ